MSLFQALSGLAVRHLDRSQVAVLRSRYHALRIRLAPLLRAYRGSFDTKELREHLDKKLKGDFEILMVHSSVNNLQPAFTGDAFGLLRMLIEFCGPERTLVMPAFFSAMASIPLVQYSQKPRASTSVGRLFADGLLTELFRRSKGVVQSRHPIYRVSALGPLAPELVRGHENAVSQCGLGTPFDYMARHDTLIIGIGKPFEVLTQIHHCEDLLGRDFPVPSVQAEPLSMTIVDGAEEVPLVLSGRFIEGRRNMWKLREIMGQDLLREWSFHGVPLFATWASDVTRCLLEAAQKGITLYDKNSA
ncbi:MAG: AAC(3) family N-acetyltransferase [Betaproteobacteria bacterium]|nr:AAC(3) family N-acetyltransferase [Betaproteobacteria bacterium]